MTLLSGLLVVLPRGDGLRCGIGLFYLGRPVFGLLLGSLLLPPLFLAAILRFGLSLLVCLLNRFVFLLLFIGLLVGVTLELVVFPMLSCSFCMRAGERLELEKAVPRYRRPGRSISVSAVPFGPGTDIWRSCRFLGDLFRVLRRFIPCDIGANHCRLRHVGWERCGHGLTSRPRESSSVDFLDKLLVLFGYPDRSAVALLAGGLPPRYCSARFAWKLPTWVVCVIWLLSMPLMLELVGIVSSSC